jgi:acyl carrier protein
MTRDDALRIVTQAFHEVAPDIDVTTVNADRPLQDEVDIDSMDFLNLVSAVHDRSGIEIPPWDFASVATLDGFVDYLMSAAASAG